MIIERQDIFGFKELNGVNKHIIYEEPLRKKTISYISIFLYSSKSILIVIICNQSTNIYEVFFNETIHIIIHYDLSPTPNYWD